MHRQSTTWRQPGRRPGPREIAVDVTDASRPRNRQATVSRDPRISPAAPCPKGVAQSGALALATRPASASLLQAGLGDGCVMPSSTLNGFRIASARPRRGGAGICFLTSRRITPPASDVDSCNPRRSSIPPDRIQKRCAEGGWKRAAWCFSDEVVISDLRLELRKRIRPSEAKRRAVVMCPEPPPVGHDEQGTTLGREHAVAFFQHLEGVLGCLKPVHQDQSVGCCRLYRPERLLAEHRNVGLTGRPGHDPLRAGHKCDHPPRLALGRDGEEARQNQSLPPIAPRRRARTPELGPAPRAAPLARARCGNRSCGGREHRGAC